MSPIRIHRTSSRMSWTPRAKQAAQRGEWAGALTPCCHSGVAVFFNSITHRALTTRQALGALQILCFSWQNSGLTHFTGLCGYGDF